MPRRTLILAIAAVLTYAGGYVAFRQTQTRTWIRDQQKYVIYPANLPGKALYYAWRPLALIDQAATGRNSRIGNHLRLQIGGPKTHT
ncbi:MAG: hypothetical protein JWR84_1843 [Caulobacter sp.]|nr:hypothetical protein [Caulobacter sp.]